jgi:hypothetical protein
MPTEPIAAATTIELLNRDAQIENELDADAENGRNLDALYFGWPHGVADSLLNERRGIREELDQRHVEWRAEAL